MQIDFVIASIDKSKGGPSRSLTNLMEGLATRSPQVKLRLHTAESANPIIRCFESSNISTFFYGLSFPGRLKGLKKQLLRTQTELFHLHTLWELPMNQVARYARKYGIPYVISPRGMLEPWALKQKRRKKSLALSLYQRHDLSKANCLHATSPMEARQIRKLGFNNPIAIIPNGIVLDNFPGKAMPTVSENKKVLFLSRIHPKKGLEHLIEAWFLLDSGITAQWQLDIVGNGNEEYIQGLRDQIASSGLERQVTIRGPVYGPEKARLYRDADLFVLPTYSENFGIVVAEALASATPVITTIGAPWEELETYHCGWWIETGTLPLKKALEMALATPVDALYQMGLRGRQLIEERYGIEAVSTQMHELYQWLLRGAERPAFVKMSYETIEISPNEPAIPPKNI